MQINLQIEAFLQEHMMPATKFGRLAAGDPRLVLDMRNGRKIGHALANRASGFMAGYSAASQGSKTAKKQGDCQ